MKHSRLTTILGALAISCTASYAQLKTGSNPATLTANTNLEVEATNGKKLLLNKADGTLTYQHTTQGAGKVLTSDANGVATWQVPITSNCVVSVAENGGLDKKLDITPASAPVYLNWKLPNLTPGTWMIHLAAFQGVIANGLNVIQFGLSLNGTGPVICIGQSGSKTSGFVSQVQKTVPIQIATAGTYYLVASTYTGYIYKGYAGLHSEAWYTGTASWYSDPAFSGTNDLYWSAEANQNGLWAVKLAN